MRNIHVAILFIASFFLSSCLFNSNRRVNGNGNFTSENRNVNKASRIKVTGSIDVYITEGPTAVKVEADENLLRYIATDVDGEWLEIKTRDHVNIHTNNPLKVSITTPNIKSINVVGSGNVTSNTSLTNEGPVKLKISGSGDINLILNTPSVDADIAGSGNMKLSGETRDVDVNIAGAGNFKGSQLKAENAKVKIAGSGDAEVFADVRLNVKIVGSGSIAYRGNASVEQKIMGSGDVRKFEP
jgi:hypothetical protein